MSSKVSRLCGQLESFWSPGQVTLFQWISWLSTDSLDFLQLQFPLELSANEGAEDVRVVKNTHAYSTRLRFILDHDRAQQEKEFLNSIFTCGICFDDKVGGDCLKFFSCSHIFCRDCLGGYFTSQIESRAVKYMLCADPKCQKQALPNEVRPSLCFSVTEYGILLKVCSVPTLSRSVKWCPRNFLPSMKSCFCNVPLRKWGISPGALV